MRGKSRFQIQENARQQAVRIAGVSMRKDSNQWKYEQSTEDWEVDTQGIVGEPPLDVAESTVAVPTIGAEEPCYKEMLQIA